MSMDESEFRKFAKYVHGRERYLGRVKEEGVINNVFQLLMELNVFSCD
jgi:hypothetical protein